MNDIATNQSPLAATMAVVRSRLMMRPKPSAGRASNSIGGQLEDARAVYATTTGEIQEIDTLLLELQKLRQQRHAEALELATTINTLTQAKADLDMVS